MHKDGTIIRMRRLSEFKKHFYILAAIFVAGLFFYITYKTPLAGDDWGYALNGMKGNPIEMTMSFYQTWSGRIFSELWGFVVAPNKWLWNIINPILFTLVFICLYYLTRVKKYHILIPFVILAVILSVDDNLRMETYTWIMGTTYIVPLVSSLIYCVILEHLMFNVIKINGFNRFLALYSNLLLFHIGLSMENIAAAMIVGVVLLLIYSYFVNKRELIPYLVLNLIFGAGAFMFMRMSPGSTARMLRDSAEWMKLSLFEKLASGYPGFIEFTFINNNYLILFLGITMILLSLYTKEKVNKYLKYTNILIQLIAIFAVFSFVLPFENNIFIDKHSMFSMLFWPIYVVDILAMLYFGLKEKRRDKAMFLYMIAGSANLVMMYSPVFGSRSAIYTVIYLIGVITIVLDSLDINKWVLLIVFLMSVGVTADRFLEYRYKYNLVGMVEEERQAIYEYYRDHPEVEEAWIKRFPIFTIHSADVEPGDTYHFETFKEYYNLPQAADKIFFYFEETE